MSGHAVNPAGANRSEVSWSKTRLCAVALVLIATVAYWGSFRGAYVFDDGLCLTGDHVIDQWFPPRPQQPTTGRGRIFAHLTFVANYKLHGFHIFGYHLVNLGIHVIAGLALFGLVRRTLLLPQMRSRFGNEATLIAATVAAVWLVHPLQTESVTYVVQRLESLAGMFFLLALYGLVRAHEAHAPWRWYLFVALCTLLGCTSKETAFVLPVALLFYDRIFLSRSWWSLVRARWLLALAMLPAFYWMVRVLNFTLFSPKSKSMGFAYKGISPWEYLRSQPGVILQYLKLTFWPQGQCLDYGWPVENDSWRIYGLGAVIVALVVASLWAMWRYPRVGFVALMFFFLLAPTSSFMPIRDLAFEHRMYLPLACVVILTVLGCHEIMRRGLRSPLARIAVPALCAMIVIGALTATTMKRNRVYHDPVDLWTDVTQKAPSNARGHYNLGECLVARGSLPGGMEQYRHLLLHDPKAIRRIGARETYKPINDDIKAAIASFQKAYEIDPKDASAHFNIGGIYDRANQPEQAMERYRHALAINKRHMNARLNLARLLAERGEEAEALSHFEKAIALFPKEVHPYAALGRGLAEWGRHDQAVVQFRKALELDPKSRRARYRLAISSWELGEQGEALALLRQLRSEDRAFRDVNVLLARYLATTKVAELRSAVEGAAIVQQVVREAKKPDVEALAVLALCQAELGRHNEAATSIQLALESAHPERDRAHVETLNELQGRLPVSVSVPD